MPGAARTVPAQLWESQFSDAAGFVDAAAGDTLFLDEVGEVPLELQPKLLRFLQTKRYNALGSPRERHADVRIVGATNRDLREAVRRGAFREDLSYRLDVLPVRVPPLRQRRGDVPLLAQTYTVQQVVAVATRPIVSAADLPLPGANAALPRERDEMEPLSRRRVTASKASAAARAANERRRPPRPGAASV